MLKSSLKISFGSVILSALVLIWQYAQEKKIQAGQLVFKTPVNQFSINDLDFEKKDGLWTIKQYDNYYANIALVRSLEEAFANTKYLKKIPTSKQNFSFINGIHIKDDIIKHDKSYWLISQKIVLPDNNYDFLLQPLVQINISDVDKLKIDGINQLIFDEELLKKFSPLKFEDVKKTNSNPKIQEIEIILKNGIILHADIYEQGWIKIDYTTAPLHAPNAIELIEKNKILYKDWYFKIKPNS